MEYLIVKTMNTETPDCPVLRGQNRQNNNEARQSQMEKENFKQYFVCFPREWGYLPQIAFVLFYMG